MSHPITGATTAQEAKATTDRTREQRRYEIARDCLAALSVPMNKCDVGCIAMRAIRMADALLAALEEKR